MDVDVVGVLSLPAQKKPFPNSDLCSTLLRLVQHTRTRGHIQSSQASQSREGALVPTIEGKQNDPKEIKNQRKQAITKELEACRQQASQQVTFPTNEIDVRYLDNTQSPPLPLHIQLYGKRLHSPSLLLSLLGVLRVLYS